MSYCIGTNENIIIFKGANAETRTITIDCLVMSL